MGNPLAQKKNSRFYNESAIYKEANPHTQEHNPAFKFLFYHLPYLVWHWTQLLDKQKELCVCVCVSLGTLDIPLKRENLKVL